MLPGPAQVGNQGEPANASFVVDTTPPQFTSINYPVATNQPNITITFEANDGLRWVTSGQGNLSSQRGSSLQTKMARLVCWPPCSVLRAPGRCCMRHC